MDIGQLYRDEMRWTLDNYIEMRWGGHCTAGDNLYKIQFIST